MFPNALPLFVRKSNHSRIYSGSTAPRNFEIGSNKGDDEDDFDSDRYRDRKDTIFGL
jgi:hypothetical protein